MHPMHERNRLSAVVPLSSAPSYRGNRTASQRPLGRRATGESPVQVAQAEHPGFARPVGQPLARPASVVQLPHRPRRRPRTLILQAELLQGDEEVHRHLGIDDSLNLSEVHSILGVCFGLGAGIGTGFARGAEHPAPASEHSPWQFTAGSERLDPATCLHRVLAAPGDALTYQWGLWRIALGVVDSVPRDDATPHALCVGGSGSLDGGEFRCGRINALLTGTEAIETTLAHAAPAVAELIGRAEIFEFIPLLQALDVGRPVALPAELARGIERARRCLPKESSQAARDAYWCCVLAGASLGEQALKDQTIATTMCYLGWSSAEGAPLTAGEVRKLCSESVRELAGLGLTGPHRLPPVERLDVYRALLGTGRLYHATREEEG